MVKKMLVRFNLDDEQHRKAVEILTIRSRVKYRSLADYIVPAVLEYASKNESESSVQISEQTKSAVIAEIIRELEKRNYKLSEPGI